MSFTKMLDIAVAGDRADGFERSVQPAFVLGAACSVLAFASASRSCCSLLSSSDVLSTVPPASLISRNTLSGVMFLMSTNVNGESRRIGRVAREPGGSPAVYHSCARVVHASPAADIKP